MVRLLAPVAALTAIVSAASATPMASQDNNNIGTSLFRRTFGGHGAGGGGLLSNVLNGLGNLWHGRSDDNKGNNGANAQGGDNSSLVVFTPSIIDFDDVDFHGMVSVCLASKPVGAVNIALSASGWRFDVPSIDFSPEDWDKPKPIHVVPIHDFNDKEDDAKGELIADVDAPCDANYHKYKCKLPTKRKVKKTNSCTSYGDPHFTTFDGSVFTHQGKGIFYLVKTEYLVVEVYQFACTIWENIVGATCTGAVAIRYGNSAGVISITGEKFSDPDWSSRQRPQFERITDSLDGIEHRVDGDSYIFDLDDAPVARHATTSTRFNYLDIIVHATPGYTDSLGGLCNSPKATGGALIDLWGASHWWSEVEQFVESWRVKSEESMFHGVYKDFVRHPLHRDIDGANVGKGYKPKDGIKDRKYTNQCTLPSSSSSSSSSASSASGSSSSVASSSSAVSSTSPAGAASSSSSSSSSSSDSTSSSVTTSTSYGARSSSSTSFDSSTSSGADSSSSSTVDSSTSYSSSSSTVDSSTSYGAESSSSSASSSTTSDSTSSSASSTSSAAAPSSSSSDGSSGSSFDADSSTSSTDSASSTSSSSASPPSTTDSASSSSASTTASTTDSASSSTASTTFSASSSSASTTDSATSSPSSDAASATSSANAGSSFSSSTAATDSLVSSSTSSSSASPSASSDSSSTASATSSDSMTVSSTASSSSSASITSSASSSTASSSTSADSLLSSSSQVYGSDTSSSSTAPSSSVSDSSSSASSTASGATSTSSAADASSSSAGTSSSDASSSSAGTSSSVDTASSSASSTASSSSSSASDSSSSTDSFLSSTSDSSSSTASPSITSNVYGSSSVVSSISSVAASSTPMSSSTVSVPKYNPSTCSYDNTPAYDGATVGHPHNQQRLGVDRQRGGSIWIHHLRRGHVQQRCELEQRRQHGKRCGTPPPSPMATHLLPVVLPPRRWSSSQTATSSSAASLYGTSRVAAPGTTVSSSPATTTTGTPRSHPARSDILNHGRLPPLLRWPPQVLHTYCATRTQRQQASCDADTAAAAADRAAQAGFGTKPVRQRVLPAAGLAGTRMRVPEAVCGRRLRDRHERGRGRPRARRGPGIRLPVVVVTPAGGKTQRDGGWVRRAVRPSGVAGASTVPYAGGKATSAAAAPATSNYGGAKQTSQAAAPATSLAYGGCHSYSAKQTGQAAAPATSPSYGGAAAPATSTKAANLFYSGDVQARRGLPELLVWRFRSQSLLLSPRSSRVCVVVVADAAVGSFDERACALA
ncbi:hypothetical protein DFJ73DRAFT_792738 [Zopfochytrium polystomum]|nr:hypothetical protein DFJ73DRAFT_792738 [Zopfochytrium polystomum]